MQFVPNGPDVPDRLLQVHEEGRVVFFCGAGISCPAGLPTFRELVEKLFESVGEPPDEAEKAMLIKGEWDRALGHYENRLQGGRWAARRHLPELLKPDLNRRCALRTHQALLTLARNREGHTRLVTTNFDTLFEQAATRCPPPPLTVHPAPPVQPDWEGLVHLHGTLPESEPANAAELNRLLLTDADFGSAYLTQGWAARFVADLFGRFTLCFVGYRIDDPLLRYMVTAHALSGGRKEFFAFAGCSSENREAAEKEWQGKHVIPICYDEARAHRALHRTLRVWAYLYSEGARGKERLVNRYARRRPTKEKSPQNDRVGRVLWALSDPSGLPAKRFAELEPAPPFKWLEVLAEKRFGHDDLTRFRVPPLEEAQEKRLLRWRGQKEIRFSLLERPAPYPLAPNMALASDCEVEVGMDAAMWHLGRWLLNYLDEPRLILWLAKQGGQLHPDFARQVHWRLEDIAKWEREGNTVELNHLSHRSPRAIPRREMRILWRLMLLGRIRQPRLGPALDNWFKLLLRDGLTPSIRAEFRKLLEPRIELSEAQDRSEFDACFEAPKTDWDKLEIKRDIALGLGKDDCEQLVRRLTSWELLPLFVEDFTALLQEALALLDELEVRLFPDLYPAAVSQLDGWARDAFKGITDRNLARRVAERWWALGHPLFRCLALFAAAQDEVIPPQTALDWLAAESARWLWEYETEREILDQLKALPKRLDAAQLSRLEQLILAGPPPDFISKTELNPERIEPMVLTRLRRLQDAGISLSQAARERLERSQAEPDLPPENASGGADVVPAEVRSELNYRERIEERPDKNRGAASQDESEMPAHAVVDPAKQGEALRSLSVEQLEQVVFSLVKCLENAGSKREVFWEQQIKPLLQKNWPKTRDKFTPEISARLARLFIATGSRFPEAMREFGHWLGPVKSSRAGLGTKLLLEADHCQQHPEASLDLLDKIADESQPVWSGDLQKCLDAIAGAAPKLAGDPRLTRLREYCLRNA